MGEQWYLGNVKVFIQLFHLIQVFGLDLVSSLTHHAGLFSIRKDKLVDNDLVGVDLVVGQLLDQLLSLIQGQEFSDAHTDEGPLFRVLELFANGSDDCSCFVLITIIKLYFFSLLKMC